jgi:uncharacterized protein YjhX (UPF0386 family)
MLILSRGVTQESIGRLVMDIDSMKKVVKVRCRDGTALTQSELDIVKKYLSYHRPDIINKAGIQTGWALTGELQIGA